MVTAASFNGHRKVRCPQQLSFLKFWERRRANTWMPALQVLADSDLRRVAKKLMLCEVVRDGDDLRFLIKLHGRQFERVQGEPLVGRFVDETPPPAFRADALSRYREVAMTGEPNFGSVLLREQDGPVVTYERLLLPFTTTGATVDYICCLVTMVSENNGFNVAIAIRGQVHDPRRGADRASP